MQKFNLKKWTDAEIVASSLTDLEQLYQAIENEEKFIFACNCHAEVVLGEKLNQEISAGNIKLKAEYASD